MSSSLGVAIAVCSLGIALGQAGAIQWERIGLQKVDRKVETDSFSVDEKENFKAIRIRVIDAGVIIEGWTFEYRDRFIQNSGFFGFVRAGQESPPIPVRGGLKKIRFQYRSAEGPKTARIEVQGRK